MDLVKELVLLKQEFEKRAARIESKDSLENIELGIISFQQLITAIEKLSLNDHYHQSLNVGKDEVHPLDGQVTKSCPSNGAVAGLSKGATAKEWLEEASKLNISREALDEIQNINERI